MAQVGGEREHWASISHAIDALRTTPGWEIYSRVLDGMITDALTDLEMGTAERFDYHKGVLEGLRRARGYPERLKSALKQG